jgi:ElaB/YqjD/DUF883 family membrane-anchored ribosome-binding protein
MSDQHNFPRSQEAARDEIERTRARMSETLDDIEAVLIRKKEHLRETLDVGARLREKPLVTAGVVLGAGFLVGFLTGGKDKKGEADRIATQARAVLWEERARRLMAIAREQEEDLEELEDAVLDAAASPAQASRWRYTQPSSFAAFDDDDPDLSDEDFDDALDDDLDDDVDDAYIEIDLYDADEDEDDEDLLVPSKHGKLSALREQGRRGGGFLADFASALVDGIRKQI